MSSDTTNLDEKRIHHILYEANARVLVNELSLKIGRNAKLTDISDQYLDRFKSLGISFIWLMSVWPTGPKSKEVACNYKDLQDVYKQSISNFAQADVLGSPYAIAEYNTDPLLGGNDALKIFRQRLAQRNIKLILDFVVNHTGLDHRWLYENPEYYIQGNPEDLAKAPYDYFKIETCQGRKIIAHGRDPYFPPWTDTAQLNLSNPTLRKKLQVELLNIAKHCDGVRCDMAMLAFTSIFKKTWGGRSKVSIDTKLSKGDFWKNAIKSTRKSYPDFFFIAEAYWGMESKLQSLGFDYTYDKTMLDKLLHGQGREIIAHLQSDEQWQNRTVRFLENHDEERVAKILPIDRHVAAAVLITTVPGMLLIHDGQLEGRKLKHPIQLRRRSNEAVEKIVELFYKKIFHVLIKYEIRCGSWALLNVHSAWESNCTWKDFIAYTWETIAGRTIFIVINFAQTQGQCYVSLRKQHLIGEKILFKDVMGTKRYVRNLEEIIAKGIYIDLPAYGFHIFAVQKEN